MSIVTPPADVLVMERSAELTVDAVGGGEITYAWYLNDQPIEGAISSEYSIITASYEDIGQYHVVVSNGASTVKSRRQMCLSHLMLSRLAFYSS